MIYPWRLLTLASNQMYILVTDFLIPLGDMSDFRLFIFSYVLILCLPCMDVLPDQVTEIHHHFDVILDSQHVQSTNAIMKAQKITHKVL